VTSRICIATPVRGAELMCEPVAMGYSESIRLLQQRMSADVYPATLTYNVDNVRARNRIAATFLRERDDCSHLLWWDNDQWPEDNRIVEQMLELDVDLVGAPYPNKRHPMRWTHQRLDARSADERGLLEVRWLGFGFTLTSRACLQRMADTARVYTDTPLPHKVPDCFGLLFFQPPDSADPTEEHLLSEDYSFCERWRQLGGQAFIYARAGIVVHAGMHGWTAADMPPMG
jgi:hypothetical protein